MSEGMEQRHFRFGARVRNPYRAEDFDNIETWLAKCKEHDRHNEPLALEAFGATPLEAYEALTEKIESVPELQGKQLVQDLDRVRSRDVTELATHHLCYL